jgi:hypothetical protein
MCSSTRRIARSLPIGNGAAPISTTIASTAPRQASWILTSADSGVNAWQFYLPIAILNPPAGPSSSLSKSQQTEPQDRSIAVEFIAEFRALLPLLLPD